MPSPGAFRRTAARLGFLPWWRASEGAVQVFLPEWLYDLAVLLFFPLNWLITALACRFPSRYAADDWLLDPALAPERLARPSRPLEELAAAVARRDSARLADADLWSLFDSLPAPSTGDMLGNWRGKVVRTGSLLDAAGRLLEAPLNALGVEWGKRFFTPYKGDPFILVLWDALVLPVPVWGNVSMPEIALRGKSGATMTYDHQPWKDHFRVLDDGKASGRRLVLGNWTAREKNGGWFTLEGLPDMDAAVPDLLVKPPR